MFRYNSIFPLLYLIIVFKFTSSCNHVDEHKTYYTSGNLKSEIILENKLECLNIYYDTINRVLFQKKYHFPEYDSVIFYYKNGNIFKNGNMRLDGKKFGKWLFYTIDGEQSEIREYFYVKGQTILNRNWFIDKSGDTLWISKERNAYKQKEFTGDTLISKNSTMVLFDFFSKDTINIDEPFAASVRCNSPLGRDYNSQIVMLLAKEKYNFNDDFSNEDNVKLDTFPNLLNDKDNWENFPSSTSEQKRYISVFGRWFDKPGKKILRGYMLESFKIKRVDGQYDKASRRVYFEKQVYVKI